jgi:hypothetical protein
MTFYKNIAGLPVGAPFTARKAAQAQWIVDGPHKGCEILGMILRTLTPCAHRSCGKAVQLAEENRKTS